MTENPVNTLKRFARETLGSEGVDPNRVKSVIAYLEGQYYIDNNVGDPNYHQLLAQKAARKAGFSEADFEQIAQEAQNLSSRYRAMLNLGEGLTREQMIAAQMEAQRKKEAIKRERDRFAKLMSDSDDQLRIRNSNERVMFSLDLVYKYTDPEYRRAFFMRVVSEAMYKAQEEAATSQLAQAEDRVEVKVKRPDKIDWDVLSEQIQRLREAGETIGWSDDQARVCDLAERLLKGETLSATEIREMGLDPNKVCARAQSILAHYSMARANVVLESFKERRKLRAEITRDLDLLSTGRPFKVR